MSERFGIALLQFASTVDIVDEAIMDEFVDLLAQYLLSELPFDFFEILIDDRVESKGVLEDGLRTLRVRGGKNFGTAAVEGGRHNHTAYSYVKKRSLWITADKQGPLLDAEVYYDSWIQPGIRVDDLPPYKSGNRFQIRTSIIQPIMDRDRACGVINVESKECLAVNDFARDELTLVADAVSAMVLRLRGQELSRTGTVEGMAQLRNSIKGKRWVITELPKIFLASSAAGDQSVRDAIKSVAELIEDHEVVEWDDRMRKTTGESRRDMMLGLSGARAIVCYLSEKRTNGQYVDNPNVLFEAGIGDGLNYMCDDVVLIPVREQETRCETKIPFDLNALTVLEVPRNNGGALEAKKFKEQLKERFHWA